MRWRSTGRVFGTTPVSELLAWLDEQEARGVRDPFFRTCRAYAWATLGCFDDARALVTELRAELADRGGGIPLALLSSQLFLEVELLAGDPEAAVELGEEGCRTLDELGERAYLSTSAGNLAQALYAANRLDRAFAWAARGAEVGASDDAITQMLWREVKAKVLAHRGEHEEAERLAHEAVSIGEVTDLLHEQANSYADLAEVLLLTGKPDESMAALEQALERYERKGTIVSAERTRARLTELRAEART
jgi:tetratricopeptide (TPR) repeat protein